MLYPSQFNDDSSERSYTMDVNNGVKCFKISCGITLCTFLTLSLFLIITGALLIEEEREFLASYDSTKEICEIISISVDMYICNGTLNMNRTDTSMNNDSFYETEYIAMSFNKCGNLTLFDYEYSERCITLNELKYMESDMIGREFTCFVTNDCYEFSLEYPSDNFHGFVSGTIVVGIGIGLFFCVICCISCIWCQWN